MSFRAKLSDVDPGVSVPLPQHSRLVIYTVVSVGLAGVALLATWLPARRASRVDPVAALRAEM